MSFSKSHNLCNRTQPTLMISVGNSCPYCHITTNETQLSRDQRLGIIFPLNKTVNCSTNVIFNIISIKKT